MHRRSFLKVGAGAVSAFALRASAAEIRVLVTDHGADPSGRRDATAAVTKAIAALPRAGGALVFPYGTYTFSPSQGAVMTFASLRGLVIEGNDSLLQFAGSAQPFVFSECSDLQLSNLRIDWPRPPFCQGIVQAVTAESFEILIDAPFAVEGHEPVQAIGEYDRAARLPAPNGVDAYGVVSSVRWIAPQTLRIALTRTIGVKAGMTLVLRHQVYGSDAITLRSCTGSRLRNLAIYTTPGLGVLGVGSTDITLEHCTVTPTPGSGRLLSTCADAVHFTDCRGSLHLYGCSFFGMGDDAVNASTSYWRVLRRISPASLEVAARGGSTIGPCQLPRFRDQLRFVDPKTFAPLCDAMVESATANRPNAILNLAQPSPAPIPLGSLVCNRSAVAQLTISNCHFLGNRARGVVAHSNARIEDNSFSGCSLAAILLAPDAHWMEGPAVHHIKVARNRIADCGYGRPNDRRGAVCVDTAHAPHAQVLAAPRVNEDIQISDNIFGSLPVPRIFCSASTGVSILRNTVRESRASNANPSDDAIVMVNVGQAVIRDNVGHNAGILLQECGAGLTVSDNSGFHERRSP